MNPARRISRLAVFAVLAVAACDQPVTSPDVEVVTSYAARPAQGPAQLQAGSSLTRQVDAFNAAMAAKGSTLRLDYPWLFTVGLGTDPYARLRTGSRWTTLEPTYILDSSDYTTDLPAADVETTLIAAYDTWNAVPNSAIRAHRIIPDTLDNLDVLDGTFDANGDCKIFDVTSRNYDPVTEGLGSWDADIVVGGWLAPEYFLKCLGSPDIIGVTWTFSGGDTNGDQYRDRVYVEQFYNEGFRWVTSGTHYLDFGGPIDLQTVAVHEDGHAHGLGHFGGPVRNQPFKLQPNLKVFNPEAVMNPAYLGGEKRFPYPTDVAGMLTMYGRR